MRCIYTKHFKIICAVMFIFAYILLSACSSDRSLTTDVTTFFSSEPEKTAGSAEGSTEKELKQLGGTLADVSGNTISILSDTGKTYSFKISDTDSYGDMIGSSAAVYYYGLLDDDLDLQNVQIEKIMIIAPTQETVTDQEKIRRTVDSMSLEEKVGQMFIVLCPEKNAAQLVSEYHLGGYILYARDFNGKTKSEVSADIKSYQDASKICMLIGVDEEGGTVNRVSIYKQFRAVPFQSPQDLYAKGGFDLMISDTKEKTALLKSIGINLNIAPVCDVSTDDSDYIHARSFGNDAALTSQYVEKVAGAMFSDQMGSVLKHFPGYGDNTDTHTGIVHDKRSYETFAESDLLPFIAGMEAGAGAVLVSHNIVECMDPVSPASLSAKVHRILRDELNFNGVIMTDDLNMDAIRQYAGEDQAAVMAVLAGNDLVCCTDFEKQIPAVIDAVKNGTISVNDIDESVIRILNWKLSLGIIKYD